MDPSARRPLMHLNGSVCRRVSVTGQPMQSGACTPMMQNMPKHHTQRVAEPNQSGWAILRQALVVAPRRVPALTYGVIDARHAVAVVARVKMPDFWCNRA